MPYDLSEKAITKAKPILDYIEAQLQAGVQEFIIPIAEPKPKVGFEHYKIPPEEVKIAMDKAIARVKLLIYQAIKASQKHGVPPYMNWDGVFKFSPVAGGLKLTVKQGTFLTVSDELLMQLKPEDQITEIDVDNEKLVEGLLIINSKPSKKLRLVWTGELSPKNREILGRALEENNYKYIASTGAYTDYQRAG